MTSLLPGKPAKVSLPISSETFPAKLTKLPPSMNRMSNVRPLGFHLTQTEPSVGRQNFSPAMLLHSKLRTTIRDVKRKSRLADQLVVQRVTRLIWLQSSVYFYCQTVTTRRVFSLKSIGEHFRVKSKMKTLSQSFLKSWNSRFTHRSDSLAQGSNILAIDCRWPARVTTAKFAPITSAVSRIAYLGS